MRNLTATICLTLAVLLESAGVSWSANLQKGLDAAKRGDFTTALKEWKPLAEKGNINAQFNLGEMYRRGYGVSLDYQTAIKWHKLAAEQIFALSQSNLGFMYANGQGVSQDLIYAHMWGNLGALNGNKNGAKVRGIVAKRMTPPQIEKAQKLARECVRKKYKGC
jgi:TPR repeat protein